MRFGFLALCALLACGGPVAAPPDGGEPDSGVPDSGVPDAGVPDAGTPDAGTPDAGPLHHAGVLVGGPGPAPGAIAGVRYVSGATSA